VLDEPPRPAARFGPALLVALALLPIFAVLAPGDATLYFRDHALVFRRQLYAALDAYARFELPLWNTWVGGGEPLLADWSSMACTPTLAVFLLPGSFDFRYDLFVFAQLVVAASGAWRLARTLDQDHLGASVAAIGYALGGVVASTNNLTATMIGLAFMPWALAGALRVIAAPSAGRVLGLALPLAWHAMYAGPMFFVVDLLLFFAMAPSVVARARPRPGAALGWLVVGGALGVGIACWPLLATLDLLADAPRGAGFAANLRATSALHPWRALEVALPGFGGDDLGGVFVTRKGGVHYLLSIYLGASLFPLAAVGALERRGRALVITAVLGVWAALGPDGGLFDLLYAIPGVSSGRYPIKLLTLTALSLPLLAGFGVQRLKAPAGGERSAAAVGALLVVAAAALVWFSGPTADTSTHTPEALAAMFSSAATLGATLAIVGAGIVWLADRAPALRGVAAFVIAADLAMHSLWLFPVASDVFDISPLAEAAKEIEDPRVLVYDAYRMPTHLEDISPADEAAYASARLTAGTAPMSGVRHVFDQDLNGSRSARWTAAWRRSLALPEAARLKMLANLAVTHVAVEANVDDPPGLQLAAATQPLGGPRLALFTIDGARRRFSFAPAFEAVPSYEDAIERVGTSTGAFVETDRPGSNVSGNAELDVTRDEPGHIVLTISSTVAGFVIVAEQPRDGWTATVDGQPTIVAPTNVLLSGVFVEPGHHEVELHYDPPAARLGLSIAALSVAVALALFVLGRRRRS
jgi:hypothetical protein